MPTHQKQKQKFDLQFGKYGRSLTLGDCVSSVVQTLMDSKSAKSVESAFRRFRWITLFQLVILRRVELKECSVPLKGFEVYARLVTELKLKKTKKKD